MFMTLLFKTEGHGRKHVREAGSVKCGKCPQWNVAKPLTVTAATWKCWGCITEQKNTHYETNLDTIF